MQFSKKLFSSRSKCKVFHASYTVSSLSGQINLLRLTFGKSNQELDTVIGDLKLVRQKLDQGH